MRLTFPNEGYSFELSRTFPVSLLLYHNWILQVKQSKSFLKKSSFYLALLCVTIEGFNKHLCHHILIKLCITSVVSIVSGNLYLLFIIIDPVFSVQSC